MSWTPEGFQGEAGASLLPPSNPRWRLRRATSTDDLATKDVVFKLEDAGVVPPVGPDGENHRLVPPQVDVVAQEDEVSNRGGVGDPEVLEPAGSLARRIPGVEDVIELVRGFANALEEALELS